MANNKSAKKHIRINKRNRLQNQFYKSSVRTLLKMFAKDITLYQVSQITEHKLKVQNRLNSIYKFLDKGIKKNVFHKNMVARKKSKLAAQFKIL
uniref:Small ribosomal subunit protein bS20c n=1 Tax=Toxarium undulatum TaxID=210620 RepID=A0A1D8D9H8_9STRA|nr:ribosomal protein S20 [Toxarium undulatum]AOS86601.1 ribosomal protein S20 [Toxarium undulatum]